MIIIVGLGNPGQKYEKTRHNLGFMTINNLQSTIDSFLDWKFKKKFNAEISKGKINGKEIILAKPKTFMNNSGQAVKSLISYYKLKTTNLFIVHDDIDLPLGKMKISKNRGAAGHKGVQSIINELKTKNFVRFRIGIQDSHKDIEEHNHIIIEDFVLQKFNKEEEKILKETIKKTIELIEKTLTL